MASGLAALIAGAVATYVIEQALWPEAADTPSPPSGPPVAEPSLNTTYNFNNTSNLTYNTYNTYNSSPPVITPRPTIVYVPGNDTGKKPDVNIEVTAPPSVPPRRLPKEADGQGPTKTPKKKSISIKTALTEKKYGGLLTHPISTKDIAIKRVSPKDFQAIYKEQIEKAVDLFALYLADRDGTLDEEDQKKLDELGGHIQPWDSTALIAPTTLAGFDGEVGLIFGLKPLSTLSSAFRLSRSNAFQEVTGIIPLKLTINDTPVVDTSVYMETASNLINSGGGLEEIKKVLGVAEFPVTVPRSLIQHTDEEMDKILDQKIKLMQAELGRTTDKDLKKAMEEAIIDAKQQKEGKEVYQKLDSIPQQITWTVKALDEVLGSFPVSITLKDSDLLKVGEEEQKLRVPNIAESLAELQGLSLLNHSATELSVNMLVRILAETGTGRQQSIKNYYLLDVLRDYLGVNTKEVQIKAPFAYDPLLDLGKDQKDEFAKFLTPKEITIDIEELDEKHSIQRWLTQVDQIYAICRAYMTRPARDKETVYKYLKDIASQFVTSKTDGDKAEPDDFDRFLESIEQGFVNEPGNTLDGKPYGREFTERPRIVRLSQKNDAQEG